MSRESYYRSLSPFERVPYFFSLIPVPRSEDEIEERTFRGSLIVSAASVNPRYVKHCREMDRLGSLPPADAHPIDAVADSAVSVGVDTTAWTTVATTFVERGKAAHVQGFWTEAESDAAMEDLQFRLRVGLAAAPNLHNIRGTRGTRENPYAVTLFVPEQTAIALEVQPIGGSLVHYARGGIKGVTFTPLVSSFELGRAWTCS